jgi:hypothetical protein
MEIILTVLIILGTYSFGFFSGVINTTETKEIQNEDYKNDVIHWNSK